MKRFLQFFGQVPIVVSLWKLFLCLVAAIVVHQVAITSIVAAFHSRAADTNSGYAALSATATQRLNAGGLDVLVCLRVPEGSGPGFCDPKDDPRDHQALAPESWLMLKVRDATGIWTPVSFAGDSKLFSIISNPVISHSKDSFARTVEWAAQAQKYPPGSTGVELCAGTRKLWTDEDCRTVANALAELSAQIDKEFVWIRLVSLFFGFIQVFTLTVFFFILLECVLLRRHLFSAPSLFFHYEAGGDGGDRPVLRLKEGDEYRKAAADYAEAGRRSPLDRLFARVIAGLQASKVIDGKSTDKSIPDTAEAFREYQISEPDNALSGLDIANEIMLKLAFAGTIWGIGIALFLARNLDGTDPVANILTKAGMFAGIGTAFGTTLWAVILSIIASIAIQRVTKAWADHVNGNYRFIVDLDVEKLETSLALVNPGDWAPTTLPKAPTPLSWIHLVGLIGLVGGLGWLILWVFAGDLHSLINELWGLNQ